MAGETVIKTSILIVEDNNDVRKLLNIALQSESENYTLLEAENGAEALEIARRKIPDVFLLDVMMPGMSGLEVCRVLKSDPKFDRSAVVMLTAKDGEEDREAGIDAGADLYMTKPFSPVELFKVVDMLIQKKRPKDKTYYHDIRFPFLWYSFVKPTLIAVTALITIMLLVVLARNMGVTLH